MNKLNFTLFIVFFLTILPPVLLAQEINITAEIRPRFEFRNGYKTLIPDTEEPLAFISQRTRLNATYKSSIFNSGLALQNVRVWGDVDQLNNKDVNGFTVHEAWGAFFLSDRMSIKAGRQEIVYDDQRIFGSVGWAQQARSHDAAILKFNASEKLHIDLGLAYNAMGETLYAADYNVNSYKSFQYLYYNGKFDKTNLSFLALNNGMPYMQENNSDTIQKVAYSQTIGSKVEFNSNSLNTNLTVYYQGGKNKYNKTLSALYISGGITFNIIPNFNIGVGTEYLSGTSSKHQEDQNLGDNSFKPYYGTNHKFNGWMDYFYVGSYLYGNGLIDLHLPLSVNIKKFTIKLIPHHFMVAARISEKQSDGQWKDLNSTLGQEIDCMVQYTLSKDMNISAGFSNMFATASMQALKGGNYNNNNSWAWLMLTFKPTFYNRN